MPEYDILIKGGTIVDGTRTPRYVSDMTIKDGKVAKIGGLRGSLASKVIDATGLIVAPGFVDLHTHYDAQIQWDPYCTVSGWHGVTSVAIGNCGFGFAPCRPEDQDRAMLALTRTEAIPYRAMKAGVLWDWLTFPEFLDSLDRIPKGLNVLSYMPLTPLYGWVMGWAEAKERRPTDSEMSQMCQLLNEAMDVGACGWSAQVHSTDSVQKDYDGSPMISDLMTDEEILTFARVLAERDEGFIEVSYSKADPDGNRQLEPSLRFYEQIAGACRRPVLYQIVQADARNPAVYQAKLRWLEGCAQKGLRMFAQSESRRGDFELTFEDWNLFDDRDSWRDLTLGTTEERKTKMQDPDRRRRLREEWDSGLRPGVRTAIATDSLTGLVVMGVGHRELEQYQGLKIGDVAEKEGKHVIDALLDLVVADDLQTEFLAHRHDHDPKYTAEVINSPYVLPGLSDGGAHVKFQSGGSFATDMLMWLVRDEEMVSLEEAHYKLSYLPAFCGGFKDRGFIREGVPADILVYDLENLEMGTLEIAHDFPGDEWRRVEKVIGYRSIIVNGQMTFDDGKPTGALPGKLLRHGKG